MHAEFKHVIHQKYFEGCNLHDKTNIKCLGDIVRMLPAAQNLFTPLPPQTWPGKKPEQKSIKSICKNKLRRHIYKSIYLFAWIYKTTTQNKLSMGHL